MTRRNSKLPKFKYDPSVSHIENVVTNINDYWGAGVARIEHGTIMSEMKYGVPANVNTRDNPDIVRARLVYHRNEVQLHLVVN